ncbi:hypothetical protein K0B96_14435 [Horticoccus luteus]|uniref:DUF4097 domain-containing protein n=1 Tax=Horticoccus luteus TaxID=2862869 RepID=A0A8F9TVE2_9BACT|nr:hypothetical protein [Horticoccus luteus]QYM78483.1 hypothetical protein K0B96_14435 [Horticoccus luteus]
MACSKWWWVLALCCATPAWALFERSEERVLTTGAEVQLHLDLTRAIVSVEPVADAKDVHLTIHRAFATTEEKEVAEMERRNHVEFTNDHGVVTLRSRYDGEKGMYPTWLDWPPVEVSLVLQVPVQCSVTLVGEHVDVTIGAVRGNVSLKVDAGELVLQQIDGAVTALTKSGSITLASCAGSAVLKAKTGSVFAGPIAGDVTVLAGGGDADVQAVSGNTEVKAVTGNVKVALAGNFAGKAKLTTDGGNVVAIFDPAASCRVEAGTFWGRVDNKAKGLVVQGKARRGRVVGALNAGKWPVEIYAGGGDVVLKTQPVAWKDALSPAFANEAGEPVAGK